MLLYRIVNKSSPVVLEDALQSYINQGWLPVGGVTSAQTTVHDGSVVWAQAMTIEAASDVERSEQPDAW